MIAEIANDLLAHRGHLDRHRHGGDADRGTEVSVRADSRLLGATISSASCDVIDHLLE